MGRLEPPPGAAGGPLRDACGQQRAGVKLRGWALGADGGVGAWDDAPVSRGVRGARARMLGADARGLAAADPAQLALQVPPLCSWTCSKDQMLLCDPAAWVANKGD